MYVFRLNSGTLYTLRAETGWIDSHIGYNTYYFPSATAINDDNMANYSSYIIAIVTDINGTIVTL